MNGLIYSKHFCQRMQQRSISDDVVRALVQYGESKPCGDGAESIFFSKRALAQIKGDHGDALFRKCDRCRNSYIVLSCDAVLITVARSYSKALH